MQNIFIHTIMIIIIIIIIVNSEINIMPTSILHLHNNCSHNHCNDEHINQNNRRILTVKNFKQTLQKTSIFTAKLTGLVAIDSKLRPKTYAKQKDNGHDHGGAGVAIDIDEAIHAPVAAASGHEHNLQNFATLGVANNAFAAIDVINPAMIGAGFLAINAGMDGKEEAKIEIKEAQKNIIINKHKIKQINEILSQLKNKQAEIKHNTDGNNEQQIPSEVLISLSNLIKTIENIANTNSNEDVNKLKLCKDMLSFARASFYAGSLINFKFFTPLLLKFLSLVGVKGAIFSSVTSAFVVAETVVLTPIITALAAIMGARAYRWADKGLKFLNKKSANIKQQYYAKFKAGFIKPDIKPVIDEMHKMLSNKLAFRKWFYKIAKKCMAIFTLGACIFTAASVAKAIILVLVLTGVIASVSNPFTGPIMIAAGILMLLSGVFFLFGHSKLHKYSKEQHEIQNNPLLAKYKISNNITKFFEHKENIDATDFTKIKEELIKLEDFSTIDQALRLNALNNLSNCIHNLSSKAAENLSTDEKTIKYSQNIHSDDPKFKVGLLPSIKRTALPLAKGFSEWWLATGYRLTHIASKKNSHSKNHEAEEYGIEKHRQLYNKNDIHPSDIKKFLIDNQEQWHDNLWQYLQQQQEIIKHNEVNFNQALNNIGLANISEKLNLKLINLSNPQLNIALAETLSIIPSHMQLTEEEQTLKNVDLSKFKDSSNIEHQKALQEIFANFNKIDINDIVNDLVDKLPEKLTMLRNDNYNIALAI